VPAAPARAALVGTAGAQAPAVSSSPIPGAVGIDGVVAVVGNTPILRTDVEERIGAMRTQGQPMPTDSAGQRALVKQIIDQLIDEDLLVQKAQALKLEVADNDITPDVDKQMSQIRSRFSTEQEFRTELRKAGFGTPDEYRRWLLDQARRSKLQQKLFDQLRQDNKLTALPVSEAEVTDFFEKNKGQLQKLPATVTLRQIVISPKPSAKHDSAALAKADSIYAELRRGGDFALIAKRESMDPGTKDLGGDLGWHRRGDFVPEFDRIYFAMPPGQISPPFKTSFGYHILKIDRVQPAEVKGRHILIRPEIDSADVAAARQEAELVAKQWRAGANFDSLVAKHHDPAEEKTIPTPFPQAQLPQEYQTAIAGHKAGDVLEPFSIVDKSTGRPKFFVVQLTTVAAEHEPSVADWRERIRDQLGQEKAIRRYLDNLRKETYVSVRM
jgi:peptidyl-prolyl cis-trans isomerase SurA